VTYLKVEKLHKDKYHQQIRILLNVLQRVTIFCLMFNTYNNSAILSPNGRILKSYIGSHITNLNSKQNIKLLFLKGTNS
jgi:hypothetical protein